MADDFLNSTQTTGAIAVGGSVNGNVDAAADNDWFRVSLTAGHVYQFDLEGSATARGTLPNPFLELYDVTGRTLEFVDDNDGAGNNASGTFAPIFSGVYFLNASSAVLSDMGTYRLSVADTGATRLPASHGVNPVTNPDPLAGDKIIDAATHGLNWQIGSTRTINWALADGLKDEVWRDAPGTIANLTNIFNNISTFANINFNYVGYHANPAEAFYAGSDITISLDRFFVSAFGGNATWAIGLFPETSFTTDFYPGNAGTQGYRGAPGDVFINVNSQAYDLPSYAPGSAGYALLIHELGHVLGLKHPFDSGGTGRPTLGQLGAEVLNNDWFSVMAYQDDYNYNFRFWDPATPMAMDVLALQYIYGANPQTNAGNTTHSLQQNLRYQAIWDAGGMDVVDVSAATAGWTITLPIYQPSLIMDTKLGIATLVNEASLSSPLTLYWLLGSIENATGSSFSDRLEGNELSNLFFGRGGNDDIVGGAGMDIARYSGQRIGYSMTGNATERTITDRTAGRDGIDSLQGIERLQFSDGVLAYDNSKDDNAGKGYLIYRAAFDRVPDVEGLGYWIRELDRGQDFGAVVAASFIASEEFIRLNGANTSNAQFVNLLYQNVLHRAGEAEGVAYWLGELNNGGARSNMLASFAVSAENVNNVAPLISDGIFFV